MSQFFLKLFRRKSSFDSLAISVEDGVGTWHTGLSRLRASVNPDKTDQTHDEKHRSKSTTYKPQPQPQPQNKFHCKAHVRMLYVLQSGELQRSTAPNALRSAGDKKNPNSWQAVSKW